MFRKAIASSISAVEKPKILNARDLAFPVISYHSFLDGGFTDIGFERISSTVFSCTNQQIDFSIDQLELTVSFDLAKHHWGIEKMDRLIDEIQLNLEVLTAEGNLISGLEQPTISKDLIKHDCPTSEIQLNVSVLTAEGGFWAGWSSISTKRGNS